MPNTIKNYHKLHVLSTSDSHQMCFCYRKLEICKFRERIGSGSALIGSERSHDREWIRSGSSPTHVISLSQSEAQKVSGSPPDPLPICSQSTPDPLPKGSPPKSHVTSKPIRE